jgi:hypothetical protein
MVAAVHEAAQLRPAPWRDSLLLFAAWAAAGWLALSTSRDIKDPPFRWQTVHGPRAAWSAEFPCHPARVEAPPPPGIAATEQLTCQVGRKGAFVVVTTRLPVSANHFDLDVDAAKGGMLGWLQETSRIAQGTIRRQAFMSSNAHLALDAEIESAKAGAMHMRLVAFGDSIVGIMLGGVSDDAAAKRFLDSFTVESAR